MVKKKDEGFTCGKNSGVRTDFRLLECIVQTILTNTHNT